ncbi:CehA/McbA family metallohydrolase [candidate division KSB1 bacterium]|nr:CehA/McbA family metallohydrolase [candidate division KSB1 bacterium]
MDELNSRRSFLKVLTTTAATSTSALPVFALAGTGTAPAKVSAPERSAPSVNNSRPVLFDGPESPLFRIVPLAGNSDWSAVTVPVVSEKMARNVKFAPFGRGSAWGIPFEINNHIIMIKDDPFEMTTDAVWADWILFMHTTDIQPPFEGPEQLGRVNEHIADYEILYENDSIRVPVRMRHEISVIQGWWGIRGLECVEHHKPLPLRLHSEQTFPQWGASQFRVQRPKSGMDNWQNFIWAWQNPHPEKKIVGFRFITVKNTRVVISAISAGEASSHPLRWRPRQKAVLTLPEGTAFDPTLDEHGLLNQIRLDLGQVISATPRFIYPNDGWEKTDNNTPAEKSRREILIEYTAHPQANFVLPGGERIPVAAVEKNTAARIKPVAPAQQTVKIRVVDKVSKQPVAVKLHVHGEAGEYLAPLARHRLPNDAWFEDYSVDFVHAGSHYCTYIPGETMIKLPPGRVFIEVSKGFEIKPVRLAYTVTADTKEIIIPLEKVLNWREKGWVTADTHVHFLSPHSALLEGACEGVNVVNLLASQWGELFTNVGDFDGKTTLGSKQSGGDGEYLVRVGTENRQHVLGHISLLGYKGDMITPLTTGGPDESALGDPIEVLMTEWAQQCKKQDGVVIIPHFPRPPMETAATIVNGDADGVEMTSWGNLYSGIDPYSLADWYRYLNCGYFTAAVGGTDKMSAGTAVGTVRTYAKIDPAAAFDYETWKTAVRKGHTFVTYGPLLDFNVDGKPMGSRMDMPGSGGTVDVTWKLASVTVPMTRVEMIVNGEVKESLAVSPDKQEGNWSFKAEKSCWLSLLVRGKYKDRPEMIAAHSSPVKIFVQGSEMYAAADAVSILEQIEGAVAYLETLGTQAEEKVYKRMRLKLQSVHRALHNRMHRMGYFHLHTPVKDHEEHRRG